MRLARVCWFGWALSTVLAVAGCSDEPSPEVGTTHLDVALVSGTRVATTASLTRLISDQTTALPLVTSLFPSSGGRLLVTVTRTRATANAVDILLDGAVVGSVPSAETVATLLVDGASPGEHDVTLRARKTDEAASAESFSVVVAEQR